MGQVLRECPQSRFIPVAKAVLWWHEALTFGETLPTKQQIRQIVDEALKIINEHPSSAAAWSVASEMVRDLFIEEMVELEDAKRLSDAVSKLKPQRRGWETSGEATLLEVLIPRFSVSDLTRQPSIDPTILARLHIREGDLEGAVEGAHYRDEAEKLLERVLAKRPERTAQRDPFFQLLEYAKQFPPLKPRLLLTAGEWAMEEHDWETTKRLLT